MNPFDKFLKKEDILQIQVCNYLRYAYPNSVVYHSPNEGKRSKFAQYLIKKLGVLAGFPDLIIFSEEKKILFIELKITTGRKEPTQKWWIELLTRFGFPAYFCFGFDEAKQVIDDFFKPN